MNEFPRSQAAIRPYARNVIQLPHDLTGRAANYRSTAIMTATKWQAKPATVKLWKIS